VTRVSSDRAKRAPQSDWSLGDAAVVVAIVLAFAAPALLGFSRSVHSRILETAPATITVAIAMSVSVAIFRLIEPYRAGLRLGRDGTLGRRLYLFVACVWILCPVMSIVRYTGDPSPFTLVAVVVQLAAIAVMFHHARRLAA
jgi:hypothetical protein